MEIAGYLAALLIGVSLGLIGGGGSILTIPVLVYLFGIPPTTATGYSLFIVGCSSLAGAYKNYRRGNINGRAALYFGFTSIITVLLIRKLLLPVIPDQLAVISGFVISKSMVTMLLFAVIMIVAANSMIQKQPVVDPALQNQPIHLPKAMIRGVWVGILTGLLGAGGGFIIIPVLIFSFHLPMKVAIGTSLLIIAMNSLFGFAGDLLHTQFDWWLLLPITAIAVTGTFIGRRLGQDLPGEKLKKWFGWFILLMGIYIIIHELFLN